MSFYGNSIDQSIKSMFVKNQICYQPKDRNEWFIPISMQLDGFKSNNYTKNDERFGNEVQLSENAMKEAEKHVGDANTSLQQSSALAFAIGSALLILLLTKNAVISST